MSEFDQILDINTPENVAFGYEIAGIGSRFIAALVDSTIIVFLQFFTISAAFAIIGSAGIFEAEAEAFAW